MDDRTVCNLVRRTAQYQLLSVLANAAVVVTCYKQADYRLYSPNIMRRNSYATIKWIVSLVMHDTPDNSTTGITIG